MFAFALPRRVTLAGLAIFVVTTAGSLPVRAFDLDDALTVLNTVNTLNDLAPQPDAQPAPGPAAATPKPVIHTAVSAPGLPPRGEKRFDTNDVLVETATTMSNADLTALGRRHRLTLVRSADIALLGTSIHLFDFTDSRTLPAVILELASERRVLFAQPNYQYHLLQQAAAGALPQYSVDMLHLTAAHALATGAAVNVGVLDTAIADGNAELTNSVASRFDPIGPVTGDDISHGTAVAGIIGAHGQMVGVAPAAAILSSRAFTSTNGSPPGSTSFVLMEGLDWLATAGTRIVNMSFAGPKDPLFLLEVKKAHDKGMLAIAAAGNDGPKAAPDYPAADPNVLGVTAVDDQQQIMPQANRGAYVALAAPGVDILVPQPDGGYGTSSGTSMAAAEVSGVAALLLQRDPALTVGQLRQALATTALDLGPKGVDPEFGAGLVDPERALQGLQGSTAALARVVAKP